MFSITCQSKDLRCEDKVDQIHMKKKSIYSMYQKDIYYMLIIAENWEKLWKYLFVHQKKGEHSA